MNAQPRPMLYLVDGRGVYFGLSIPNHRCSTNQDVSRALLVSSLVRKAHRAWSVMKYFPPARGESTDSRVRVGASDWQDVMSVPR